MHVQFVGDPFHSELAPYQIPLPTKQKLKFNSPTEKQWEIK